MTKLLDFQTEAAMTKMGKFCHQVLNGPGRLNNAYILLAFPIDKEGYRYISNLVNKAQVVQAMKQIIHIMENEE